MKIEQIAILRLLLCTFLAHANPPESLAQVVKESSQENKVSEQKSDLKSNEATHLNNAQTLEQKVVVATQKDPTDCTQLHGFEFMDCMRCQSPENLKNNLMRCNDRLAQAFFLNLFPIDEYVEVLQHFTAKDWELFYQSRNAQTRDNFPKTLEEQRLMLKQLYIDAYFSNYFTYLFSGQSADKTEDLETLIKDFNVYYARCNLVGNCSRSSLNKRFLSTRHHLFSKLR